MIMTYKQIEASREIRLWITRVIIPGAVVGYTVLKMNPDLKDEIAEKFNGVKSKIKNAFHK